MFTIEVSEVVVYRIVESIDLLENKIVNLSGVFLTKIEIIDRMPSLPDEFAYLVSALAGGMAVNQAAFVTHESVEFGSGP